MQVVPLQNLGRTDEYAERKTRVLVLPKDRTSHTRLPKKKSLREKMVAPGPITEQYMAGAQRPMSLRR